MACFILWFILFLWPSICVCHCSPYLSPVWIIGVELHVWIRSLDTNNREDEAEFDVCTKTNKSENWLNEDDLRRIIQIWERVWRIQSIRQVRKSSSEIYRKKGHCYCCVIQRFDQQILFMMWHLSNAAFIRMAASAALEQKSVEQASYLWLGLICSLCTSLRGSDVESDPSFSGLVANLFWKTKPRITKVWSVPICSIHKNATNESLTP